MPGRVIDDNVQVLLRFANGARGSLWASQVAIGHLNSHQLRVYCEGGSIIWLQERPEELMVMRAGEAPRFMRRGDPGTLTSSVALPGGHPEGFIEAFSQLYTDFAERVTARLEKRERLEGIAGRARRRHRHPRHGVHRSGAAIEQGGLRLDEVLVTSISWGVET